MPKQNEEKEYKPAPADRSGDPLYREDERDPRIARSESPIKSYIIMAIIAIAITFVFTSFITPMVGKKVYQNDITRIEADLVAMRGTDTELSGKINGVVSTTQSQSSKTDTISARIDSIVNKVGEVTSNIGNLASKSSVESGINGVKTEVNTAKTSIVKLEEKIATQTTTIDTLTTKVAALEAKAVTPPPNTGSSIPGVTITTTITDEGALVTSDNSTHGEVKFVISNTSTRDIEDIVISLTVWIDDCGYANLTTMSASGYGTWSIRNSQTDEIELRGRLASLEAGETRKIYFTIKSFAINYQVGGRTTTLDTDNEGIEIISWDYSS